MYNYYATSVPIFFNLVSGQEFPLKKPKYGGEFAQAEVPLAPAIPEACC